MTAGTIDSSAEPLDAYVAAFEAAWTREAVPDLKEFLPPRSHPLYLDVLCELVRVDLEFGWEHGQARPLDHYQERFPELFANPSTRQQVAFEEYRLRRQAGDRPTLEEYQSRYEVNTDGWPRPEAGSSRTDQPTPRYDDKPPTVRLQSAACSYRAFRQQGQTQPSMDLDAWVAAHGWDQNDAWLFRDLHESDPHAADQLAAGLVRLPEASDDFMGFELIEVLGRGAFGCVYLALQGTLADRPVALKVAVDVAGESYTLAQLQHTHIVPIYSIHSEGNLQAVCMPYFGRVTLADVLRDLGARPSIPRSGLELFSTLAGGRTVPSGPVSPSPRPAAVPSPASGPWKTLAGLNYVDAVLWLGSCLADGLAHAHERGILHRDLKPANVLLTEDGQPMLLDFNLAVDTKRPGGLAAEVVGGTLPYMAPEHLRAFHGGDRDRIDGRSDIFSLGIILYELLARRPAFPARPRPATDADSPERPHEMLERMIQERCQPLPSPRRCNPAVSPAAAAIVAKCLEPDPARRYQSARHLHEDLHRQLENRPLRYARDPSLAERVYKWRRRNPRALLWLTAAAMVLGLAGAAFAGLRARHLALVRDASAAREAFRGDLRTVQFLLNTHTNDPTDRAEGASLCREALARYGAPEGNWTARPLVAYLPVAQQRELHEDVGELLLLLARAKAIDAADAADSQDLYRAALHLNEQAESCFTAGRVPPAVERQRADLLARLGETKRAEELRARSQGVPLQSARDHYLAARELYTTGRERDALPLLRRATQLEPASFWAWFLLGCCHDRLGDDGRAVASYNAALALAPDFYGVLVNRGLAFLRQKEYALALDDFDEVIRLQPVLTDSYVNRALALQGLKRHEEAARDLTTALERGAPWTRLYFLRARVREQLGDRRGAEADRQQGLRREPQDEKSWVARGMARMEARDLTGALADFEKAAALNPRSRPALQNQASVLADKLHEERKAVPVLDRVVALYPDYVPARIGRAVVQARLGEREAALSDVKESLARDRSGSTLYRAACVYALLSERDSSDSGRALRLLREALEARFGNDLFVTDPDLKPVRHLAEFRRLAEADATLRGKKGNQ